MNKMLLLNYINKLTKEDINTFSLKQGITLTSDELDTIYNYIKDNTNNILTNPDRILIEIKNKVSNNIYQKILELYNKYKYFLDK